MELHIKDEGSLFLLQAGNDATEQWLADNLDPACQKWGSSYVIEHRYVDAIVQGFEDAGGTVNLML